MSYIHEYRENVFNVEDGYIYIKEDVQMILNFGLVRLIDYQTSDGLKFHEDVFFRIEHDGKAYSGKYLLNQVSHFDKSFNIKTVHVQYVVDVESYD